ncbi:hypothetical protein F4780DRAFT_287380 [Xylariomycetidae sp. FL0641]|nr:hypothetical protein F4780DRAFT_287380 [Xylariomycetidae sp. FL0641]
MGVITLSSSSERGHPSRSGPSAYLKSLIAALSVCILLHLISKPSTPPIRKALVIAGTAEKEEGVEWLAGVPLDWEIHYYVADNPLSPGLAVPANRGNEAMAYLTFIIDNYDHLPDVTFFHHDHYQAWHQGADSLTEVVNLQTDYVLERGYVSTRCLSNCENYMPVSKEIFPLENIPKLSRDKQLSSLLKVFLDHDTETMPKKIAAPCCAQFAASKEAIGKRSLQWWKDLRQWLLDTDLPSASSGRLIEWTWHIWLGEEPVHCAFSQAQCLCNVFGYECDSLNKEAT